MSPKEIVAGLLAFALCSLCSNPLAAELTLAAISDSYTRADEPTRNFGNGSSLWISHWSFRQAYLQFETPDFLAGPVTSAALQVTLNQVPNDGDLAIHLIQSDWSESSITANSPPTVDPVAMAVTSVVPGDGGKVLTFDVTLAVQMWQASPETNFGLAILPNGSNWVGASVFARETTAPATLTVSASGGIGNSAPVARDDAYSVNFSSSQVLLDVLANDSDADLPDDILQIVGVNQGSDGGVVANNSTSLGYTPPAGFVGTETFLYTVADRASETATATVRVTVAADPGPSGSIATVVAQDSYTRADQPASNFGTSTSLWVSHWSSRQAFFKFEPASLPSGFIESANLSVRLDAVPNDGAVGVHVVQSNWNESAITGSALPTIDPIPLATAFITPADAGSGLEFDVAAAVRAWQASPNTNFGLALLPNGGNWVGASVSSRESDTPAVLSIETAADGENRPPSAADDSYSVDGSTAEVVLGVMSNDTDADLPNDSLRVVSVGPTSSGGVAVNNTSSVSYTPAAGFAGTEIFEYTIADESGATATATVTVVVSGAGGRTWKIMPLGDSITEASGSRNSYRRPLWQLLRDSSFDVDFVGSRSGNRDGEVPDPDFDTDHEGHWGWKADRFLNNENIATWSRAYQPDVVLIHLGTNDIFGGQSVSSTIAEIGTIIDILREANPGVVVLVAKIIPTSDTSRPSLDPFNEAVPGLVASKDRPESPVRLVDQNSGFDAVVDTYDGVHPDLSGENKMAQKWFEVLRELIAPD